MSARTLRRPTKGVGFVALLGALAMLPPLSIDVSLPGLPVIANDLDASDAAIARTLSTFILAFGAGQLVAGPLADRFGRRPVVLIGLALYVAAGLACAATPNAAILLTARFVQGLGACVGLVCARAIARDVAPDGDRAHALQAYITALMAVAPIIAPILGAGILAVSGWRALYGVLVLAGLALIVAVALFLPESGTRAEHDALTAYRRVLRLPGFVALACVIAGSFGGYFALVSGSPFALVRQMHVAPAIFPFAFAISALASLLGSYASARSSRRFGRQRVFGTAVALFVVAGATVFVVDSFFREPIGFVATMSLLSFIFGLALPGAYASALEGAAGDAGTASGLLGASQMFGGAIGSAAESALPLGPAMSIGVTVAAAAIGAAIAYRAARPGRAPS